ncbi:MAG: hypothetical protein WDZ59_04485 [Pirellulales bacterium]
MRYRWWITVLGLVLVSAFVAQPVAAQEETILSFDMNNQNAWSIDRPVVISFDPELLQPGARLILDLLRQPEFKERVVARIEQSESDPKRLLGAIFWADSGFEGEVVEQSSGVYVGRLVVQVPKETPKDDFREIWDSVRVELEKSIRHSYERLAASRTNSARDRLQAMIDKSEVHLEDLESRLRQSSLNDAAPADMLKESLQAARTERRQLQSDIVTAEARQNAIQKQIALLREESENDPVRQRLIEELEKIVKIREQELERADVLQRAATISQSEVASIQAALAAAKIDLFRAQSSQGEESVQQQQLQRLNVELLNFAIERDANRRRIAEAEETIAELTHQLQEQVVAERRTEELQREIKQRRQSLDVLREQLFELELKESMRAPVTVTPWFGEEPADSSDSQ